MSTSRTAATSRISASTSCCAGAASVIVVVDAEADLANAHATRSSRSSATRASISACASSMPWDAHPQVDHPLDGLRIEGRHQGQEGRQQGAGTSRTDRMPRSEPSTMTASRRPATSLYIKSSLTGDENDYMRDYARRYHAIPARDAPAISSSARSNSRSIARSASTSRYRYLDDTVSAMESEQASSTRRTSRQAVARQFDDTAKRRR